MKKEFENPDLEIIHFGSNDIVRTSGCCDVGGTIYPSNDNVCPYGDAECECGQDIDQNCD